MNVNYSPDKGERVLLAATLAHPGTLYKTANGGEIVVRIPYGADNSHYRYMSLKDGRIFDPYITAEQLKTGEYVTLTQQ